MKVQGKLPVPWQSVSSTNASLEEKLYSVNRNLMRRLFHIQFLRLLPKKNLIELSTMPQRNNNEN
jgi:hypothetical protein